MMVRSLLNGATSFMRAIFDKISWRAKSSASVWPSSVRLSEPRWVVADQRWDAIEAEAEPAMDASA
jgi:hypothetical protein